LVPLNKRKDNGGFDRRTTGRDFLGGFDRIRSGDLEWDLYGF